MKKLITICLFMATFYTAFAQNKKPTKEETIQFIQKTVNSGGRLSEFTISDTNISWKRVSPSIGMNVTFKHANVRFDKILKVYESSLSGDGNSNVTIEFSINTIKFHSTGTHYEESVESIDNNRDKISLILPRDKVQSIIKAFDRLKEITIEENKDPFEN
nr:hypothetical protein [uncultured Flavobacterium sp.]